MSMSKSFNIIGVAGCVALVAGVYAYARVGVEDDPYDEAITYKIASPSDAVIAVKHHPPSELPEYTVTTKRVWWDSGLERRIDWTKLFRSGLGKSDAVLLSWDGDTHLTVAGPFEATPPSGPDHLGAVQLFYAQYVRGRLDDHGPYSSTVTLVDVTYSVEWVQPVLRRGNKGICILHVEGRDGQFQRLVGFDVIGPGSSSTVLFAATYLSDAVKRLTLTQGALSGFNMHIDPKTGLHGPIQDHLSAASSKSLNVRSSNLIKQTVFYEYAFRDSDFARIFDLMRDGRFEAVFEFSLGAQVVTYRFAASVPKSVAEEFAGCEADIDPAYSSIISHLVQ